MPVLKDLLINITNKQNIINESDCPYLLGSTKETLTWKEVMLLKW